MKIYIVRHEEEIVEVFDSLSKAQNYILNLPEPEWNESIKITDNDDYLILNSEGKFFTKFWIEERTVR